MAARSFDEAVDAHLRDVRAAMTVAVNQAGELLLQEMRFLTSRIDHDLIMLRKLGRPYRKDAPQGQPHPDWLVHLQSGDLNGGLAKVPATVSRDEVRGELFSKAAHTWFVLLGTKWMRPRDFVSAALILRDREVDLIFRRAFEAATGAASAGRSVNVTLLEHPEFPAQLPGGV